MKKLTLLLILLAPPMVAANDSCHPKTGTYQDCIAYLGQQIGALKKQNLAQRANIKQQIGRLETENQAQLSKLERIQAQLAKLKPMAADDPCNLKDFGTFECILSITHRIAQLEKKTQTQQAQIQRLTANNQAQQAQIQRLTTDNQAQQAEIQRLTKVDNNQAETADKLSKRLNNQAETVGELSKQLTKVDNKHVQTADKLSKRITAVDNKHVQRADGLSKRLTAVDNKQAQTAGELSKRLNKQAETVGELSKRLTAVDNKHVQRADGLSKRVTALDNKQAEMAAELCMPFAKQNDNIDWTPGKVFHDCLKAGTKGPKMVVIPAGTFRMGDIQGGGYSNEQPVHEVSIKRVAIGRYEVTFAEYDKFAEATGRAKPSDSGYGRGNRPVINVSWDDATAYANWLTKQTGHHYRLPTEAEWEYTARAGTETKYWWGNDIGSNRANCSNTHCGDSFKYTAPVGSFAANPFGLFDTAGNVYEWTCSEYQDKYSGKEQRCANSGSLWALHGGAWNYKPRNVRAATRGRSSHDDRYDYVGLRLARQF